MSEQTPNTACRICGKKYYACAKCGQLNHWKAVACCPEHFEKYLELIELERNKPSIIKEELNQNINNVVVEATDSDDSKKITKSKRKNISENNE